MRPAPRTPKGGSPIRNALRVTVSVAIFTVGLVWVALDIIGTAATVMDLFEWVPMWVRKLAAHEEAAYQIGPWVLMSLGALSLLAVHFWPSRPRQAGVQGKQDLPQDEQRGGFIGRGLRLKSEAPRITPEMVRVGRAAMEAGEEIKRQWDEASAELDRRSEPKEQGYRLTVLPDGTVPLPEAARLLYEIARSQGKLLAVAAERMSGTGDAGNIVDGTPEDILNFMATYIGGKDATLYGVRPPSEKREYIAKEEAKRGAFESGALVLKGYNVYTDLSVEKSDLFRIISALEKTEI